MKHNEELCLASVKVQFHSSGFIWRGHTVASWQIEKPHMQLITTGTHRKDRNIICSHNRLSFMVCS